MLSFVVTQLLLLIQYAIWRQENGSLNSHLAQNESRPFAWKNYFVFIIFQFWENIGSLSLQNQLIASRQWSTESTPQRQNLMIFFSIGSAISAF